MTELVLAYDRSPKSYEELRKDLNLLKSLRSEVDMIKLGLESMTAQVDWRWTTSGRPRPRSVAEIVCEECAESEIKVLWDLKVHDIGNTMAATVRNLARVPGIDWVTIHASASDAALRAVAQARDEGALNHGKRLGIFAVTVLTDIDVDECETRFGGTPFEMVKDFAQRVRDAGLDGIVCSGEELEYIHKYQIASGLKTLVPGIRPPWASHNDQKRVMTPEDAAAYGADYVVIGRPIMENPDPAAAAKRIREELTARECEDAHAA